ncbi:hypothetical protein Tco_1328851 [Tanacetum coccineum]
MVEDDQCIGNLKFVPKGEEDEVFGIQIPKELITNNIRNAPYFNAYLEMVAKHDRKITAEEGGKKKSASKADQSKKPATSKKPKPVSSKQSKPAPAKQPKPVKEKSTKPSLVKKASKGKVGKVGKMRKGKSSLHLVDELDEEQAQPEPEPQGEERRILVTEEASTGPSAQPKDDTSANIVRDTPSPIDAEIGAETDMMNSEGDTEILNIGEEQGKDVANKVDLEEKTVKIDEGQAGSNPGKTPESLPPPERVLMTEDQAPNPGQSHMALAGTDPKPMHDDFVATMYPQVHESLKHLDEEHVHLENPQSSTRTLSSMKNLDNFTFGDQFIADKSSKDETRNANMETKVESMVTVPIHQASSSVPPLSTPVINLSAPKLVSSLIQASIFTTKTKTTTTTTLPPPAPQQQSITDPALASYISVLETICANFEKRHKLQDKNVQAIKEAVQIVFQALFREHFRYLSEAYMKEIPRDRMFESGSYRSQPEHVALYEALEASMERDNRDELLTKKDKSCKRRRDDQDPPPPPTKEYEQSKKKKQDSNASDVPIPDDVHILDFEDIGAPPLSKIKTIPNWLKLVPEEDRLKTPEPDWTVPPNDLPEHENNWANAFATLYKDPEENKLL